MFQDFWQQFVLTKRKVTLSGFVAHSLSEWFLHTHPALQVQKNQFGWLIGIALEDPPLSGRFVTVHFDDKGNPTLELDGGGTLAVVYSAKHEIAASTLTIANSALSRTGWQLTTSDFPSDLPNQFWPGDLTADPDFRRLLPNHKLDLSSWRASRSWLPPRTKLSARRVAKIVSRRLLEIISNIGRHYQTIYLPLTAGRDSRCLVAAAIASGMQEKFTFVTFNYGDTDSDVRCARRIADRFRLRHEVLSVEPSLEGEQHEYIQRIGYAGGSGKASDFYNAALRGCDLSGVWVTGFAGEVGRAFYWKNNTSGENPEDILIAMGLPGRAEFISSLQAWMDALPSGLSRPEIMDLVYLEMRVGSWASAHMYGTAPFAEQFVPFADRKILEALLSAPLWYRESGQLSYDVIGLLAPALDRPPFAVGHSIRRFSSIARPMLYVRSRLKASLRV